MKQQTAVEWLWRWIHDDFEATIEAGNKAFETAKQMEKEQHNNTWYDSTAQFDNAAQMTYKKEFEEYYNETYNK